MDLAIPSLSSLLRPSGALPLVREPNRRWSRGAAAAPVRPVVLNLTVREVVVETASTKTLVLEGDNIHYRAGQHLTIVADIDGRTVRRCYSFSSSPAGGGRPAITVKRVAGGVLSNWLHDSVRPGDVLRALPASGSFTLASETGASRHIVMVAGGVGITPLISLAETALRDERGSRVTLLYGSRSEDEIIFRSRIEAMERAFPRRFDSVLVVDDAGATWRGLSGALRGERVVSIARDLLPAAWYVCGPQPMMDSVVDCLQRSGVDASHIHVERFQYAEAAATRMPGRPATLVFETSGTTAIAPAGMTLLDAAEQAGVALPSSCRMGGCGACKVRVEGQVVAAEPNCLTDDEREQGYALACCSWGDGRVVIRDY